MLEHRTSANLAGQLESDRSLDLSTAWETPLPVVTLPESHQIRAASVAAAAFADEVLADGVPEADWVAQPPQTAKSHHAEGIGYLGEWPGPPSPGGLVGGGEDWLETRVEGCWCPVAWPVLREKLQAAKEAAGRKRDSGAIEVGEGDTLVLQKRSVWDKSGRIEWDFVCAWQGNTLMFRDSRLVREGEPAVKVELKSEFLMRHGGPAGLQLTWDLLTSMGFRRGEDSVSRVDPCADVYGLSAEGLIDLARGPHAIRRADRSWCPGEHWDEALQRMVVHSWAMGSNVKLRIYCKGRELIENKRKAASEGKAQVLKVTRWGVPEETPLEEITATRVEFELRTAQLRKMGIKSAAQWFARRAGAVAWLTQDWFRIAATKPDRGNGHQGRSIEFHADWEKVCRAFSWAGHDEPLKMVEKKPASIRNLVMGGCGYLTAIMARASTAVSSVEDGLRFALSYYDEELARVGRSFLGEVGRKRADYIAATGAVVIDPGDIPY